MGLFDFLKPKTFTPRSGASDTRLPKNRAEAEFMAPGLIKIAQDSVKLVNTTKKPDVFFDRYDLLLDCTEKLSLMKHLMNFSGTKPSKQLATFLAEKEKATSLFIKRFYQETIDKIKSLKTDKAKHSNAIQFYVTLEDYFHRMTQANINEIEELNIKLENAYGPKTWVK